MRALVVFYSKVRMSSFALASPCKESSLSHSHSYVEDVLKTMLTDQSDHVYSKFSESYIKYRRVVVEWMVDVAEYFNLHMTTTHAAIAYLDRLQPNEKYSRFEWQMMAICCLIISSKYNECESDVPPFHKLEDITQQAMTNECVLNYELWALKRMGWKLNARTPMAFLDSYIYLAQRLPDADLEHMSCFFCPDFESSVTRMATKCMVDHSFKALPASAIAAGIIYFTRETAMVEPVWTSALSRLTGHDAPTSRSVQRVLELLDAIAHDEAVTAQGLNDDSQLLIDSSEENSMEDSREETDALAAVMQGMGVEEQLASYQHRSHSPSPEGDEENARPAQSGLSSAAARVMGMFSAQKKPLQPQLLVTPALKAQGGAAGEKTDLSPVSIADYGL